MKLEHLWVDDFKNLRECEIEFAQPTLLSAVIGGNGSGKSNLVEAILHILIGVYFKKAPPFNFEFRFESQRRQVTLKGDDGRLSTLVDGERVPLKYFAERLRGGPAQVYYPELTFVYYVPPILSSESPIIRKGRSGVKKRFTEAQIIGFLREAEAGLPVKDLCRRHGFSEASYYL